MTDAAILSQIMDSMVNCLSPETAQCIVSLRASPAVQARLDELAEKSLEGTLSSEEQTFYESCLCTIHHIADLQARARRRLSAET